ncbi:MAG: hypothetical protein CVU65_18790, partial [Deltaproteobacteria bacterium HGW-Deltaproteobacteria-22]
ADLLEGVPLLTHAGCDGLDALLLPFREQFTHSMEIVLPAGGHPGVSSMLDRALSGLRNMGYRPQELTIVAGPLHEAAEQSVPAADLIRLGLSLLRKEKP